MFAAELDKRTAGVTTNSDSSYYIDNVFLTASEPASAVSAPATFAISALGIIGLAIRRFKRSS